jgi:Mrp family chromosome partitioning ATPase
MKPFSRTPMVLILKQTDMSSALPPGTVMWSILPNLWVVPVGTRPSDPTELLGSNKMAAFIKELRDEVDFVLIDVAPMLVVADAATVAPACDGVVIVADAQSAVRSDIIGVREQLQRMHTRTLALC